MPTPPSSTADDAAEDSGDDAAEDSGDDSPLSNYTFQLGPTRGPLAHAIDLLTDTEILLGQHQVYTHGATNREIRDKDITAALARLREVRSVLVTTLSGLAGTRPSDRGNTE